MTTFEVCPVEVQESCTAIMANDHDGLYAPRKELMKINEKLDIAKLRIMERANHYDRAGNKGFSIVLIEALAILDEEIGAEQTVPV